MLSNIPAIITAICTAIGNTLEALAGAFLFRRYIGLSTRLDRARDAFAFASIAVVMCLIACTIGPLIARLTGVARWDTFGTAWFTWWLGDVAGVLTVTPLFFHWRVEPRSSRSGKAIAESALLFSLLASACFFIFGGYFRVTLGDSVEYLIIPILLWIVFRCTQRRAAIAVAGVAGAAVWGTTNGYGPFVADSLNTSLLLVQGFVGALSVTLLVVASTVSERHQAEAELRNAQHRQDLILQTVPMALYTTDPSRRGATWISPHVESICGFPADQFINTPGLWADRIHPDDRAKTLEDANAVLRGQTHQMEYRWRCADGEYRWFHDHRTLIQGDGSKPTKVVGTWLDITNRKVAEIALKTSEIKIAAILEHSPALISLKDADGRYLLANKKLTELTGVPLEKILGKTDADLFAPEFADVFHESDQAVLKGTTPVEREQVIPHRDGLRTYITLKFLVWDELTHAPIVCAIATDITERKRTEETLEAKNAELSALAQELSTLLEHARDFVYRHNPEGVLDYVSPSIKQITGYSVEEWKNHRKTYLTDSPLNEQVVDLSAKSLHAETDVPPYLIEIYHKRGHRITLEVNERSYTEHGKVAGMIGVARDVTERIRVGDDLKRAKNAAEAASRAKGVFLANLSHELRTPIMAIMGAAELAASSSDNTTAIESYRNIALRNGQLLLALINDLLDVARMEAGKIDIVRRKCSLVEIITNVHAATASLPDASNIELRFEYQTDIPEMIETDPTRLTQAIINLVGNALKFTLRGYAHVSIAVHRDKPDPRLAIRVEDTGQGIPSEAHARIFENFAQIGTQTDNAISGVGLGLPLAKGISEQLGGYLHVESQVGLGSIFTLAIATGDLSSATWIKPSQPTNHIADNHPEPPAQHLKLRAHILLAEDFRDTRELLRIALESAGASVVAVDNGREAVDAAAERQFDLILLDIRMPVMDGREAVRQIRLKGSLAPMIALTASTNPGEFEKLIAEGFDDVWPKPLTIADLMSRIAGYTDSVPDSDESTTPKRIPPAATPHLPSAATRAKLAQIRAAFIKALPERVDGLRAAATRADRSELRERLHQLVGSAGLHELPDISTEAARLLQLAKSGALDHHPQRFDHLAELTDTACGSI